MGVSFLYIKMYGDRTHSSGTVHRSKLKSVGAIQESPYFVDQETDFLTKPINSIVDMFCYAKLDIFAFPQIRYMASPFDMSQATSSI